jgi:hypothetical protein
MENLESILTGEKISGARGLEGYNLFSIVRGAMQ